jgi:hypothetical protein
MEADWTVALAAADPVIIVPWSSSPDDLKRCKFVDLRPNPDLIDEIEEAKASPGLRSALLLLNGRSSQLWTAKCDTWTRSVNTGDEPLDPYEMDADPGETDYGAGSYIDLLPRDAAVLCSFEIQEHWMRAVTEQLRKAPARAVRVELVLRHAQVSDRPGFAVTWFVDSCGATVESACQRWEAAIHQALTVMMREGFDAPPSDDTMIKTGE